MKKVKPTKTVGYAWVGMWASPEDKLGFQLPNCMNPGGSEPLTMLQKQILARTDEGNSYYPSDFYRVKVTLTPLKNKNGQYIVRRNKWKTRT